MEIVKYIYSTGYEEFEGETQREAENKFEYWIDNNTPYRGLGMYAKHKGYHLYFEDAEGIRYTRNGMTMYKVDKYGNILGEA